MQRSNDFAGRPRWKRLLAALGWIGAGLGFSRVVPFLWSATQLYGTLGSVVLFLIWAYLNSWILLLGGFLLVPRPTEVVGQLRRGSCNLF